MVAGFSRRQFLIAGCSATLADAIARTHFPGAAQSQQKPFAGKLCLFSKHLPDMDWRRLAQNVKKLGFDGIDLTARKGGHVLPERAADDLPRAVETIRAEGLEVPMITTELVSATHPTAHPILSTAGKLSIPFYKPGYYKYEFLDVRAELEKVAAEFRKLAGLGKQYGVQVGYHNHAGYVGAAIWDIMGMIDPLDSKWVGYYFDACHAVTEGGLAAWKIALNMISRRIKMIAIKDFYWEKAGTKGWRPKMCPLGEGMVDWKYYFKALAQSGFHGPVSLHLEYDIPGTGRAQEENTLVAAQRDLNFLKARIKEAYV